MAAQHIHGWCAMCVSRCGCIAEVEDGRFVALHPDPAHPTGQALCAKGRAAPELVYHPDRLLYPLKRTRPKGDADPGWQRIGWDEALDTVASRLNEIARTSGPESVVFSIASPSTSGSSDSLIWTERLMRAYGSPNEALSMELCGWGRYGATMYTFGASVPGAYMPDLERAGVVLFWGYNPHLARIAHAVGTTSATKRGARLIVVDPRRAGVATKADIWLRVRPGTDAALALGLAHVMLERGWYDEAFVRTWTNAPLLVREDNGRLLRASDLGGAREGAPDRYVAWHAAANRPAVYDPATGSYDADVASLALAGEHRIATSAGEVVCRPVFERLRQRCAEFAPARVESICGVAAADVERAAGMLWTSRPLAYYAWSGVEQQTNATQIARAIAQLSILTAGLDVPGGNVAFTPVPVNPVGGDDLLPPAQRERTLGRKDRPFGPARLGYVTSHEIYRAILDGEPYRVRGMVGFGANLLLAHADSARGRRALEALDFYVHADLFMTPTAAMADIVLPVASPFEREALRAGFEISQAAQSHVQLRPPVVPARGESRSDIEIAFELATRLGLGEKFWNGDIEAAYRHHLAPSGMTLEQLRARPQGVSVPLETRHRKFADARDGTPRGFATPTKKIELYSETLLTGGHDPLPAHETPLVSHEARPELRDRFPLVLTCAKHTLFCETQHRNLPSLRRHARDPEVELHPAAATARAIGEGDWVEIETPHGRVRARAAFNDTLAPDVVCGQHGWWESCAEIGAPAYDPFSSAGANFNLVIGNDAVDPISGSVPHRAYVCEVRRV